MKFNLLAISLIGTTLACGCAGAGVYARGGVVQGLPASERTIVNDDQAKEVFLALRDQSLFPGIGVSEVELSSMGVTLRGPDKTFTMWSSQGYSTSYGHAFGNFANAAGSSATSGQVSNETTKEAVSIWFGDIEQVSVSRVEQVNGLTMDGESVTGIEPGQPIYECALKITDRGTMVFSTPSANFAHRLAQAFTLKAAHAKWVEFKFPKCGAIIDAKTGYILRLKKDGPFDVAKVPMFSRVDSVDGKEASPGEVGAVLDGLKPGKHSIGYHPPTQWLLFNSKAEIQIM